MPKSPIPANTFYRICIEGNIGCGKTSVLKRIAAAHKFTDYEQETWRITAPENGTEIAPNQLTPGADNRRELVISPEPLARWQSVSGDRTNLLARMYADPRRWAFTFEHYSQYTRYDQMKSIFDHHHHRSAARNPTIHLLERSIFSNRFCFIENFFRSGKLEVVEYQILDQWFAHLMARPETCVNMFIYLQTSPPTVYDRIAARARSEEDKIPLDYLTEIHQYHERLFNQLDPACWQNIPEKIDQSPPQVVVIDANLPFESVYQQVEKHISTIIA